MVDPMNLPQRSEDIIREVWDYYNAHGGSIIEAIDETLKQAKYGTSFRAQFPEFARTNYFLSVGTYTDRVLAFPRMDPLVGPMAGEEWQLFRIPLNRADPLVPGTQTFRKLMTINTVRDGPLADEPHAIDHLGILYLEFAKNNFPQNGRANFNITIKLIGAATLQNPNNYPRVSVMAIPDGRFNILPHPINNFINPVAVAGDLEYSMVVQNFDQMDRVAVVITNMAGLAPEGVSQSILYTYHAETIQP